MTAKFDFNNPEDNQRDVTIYMIAAVCMFLEFYNPLEKVFEYYLKYSCNDFEYQFGVTEPFSPNQLRELFDQGYFS